MVRRRRRRRKANPSDSLGTALTIELVGAGLGAALGALRGQGATGMLTGAAAMSGLVAVAGLVGMLFDVEAGLETAGIGLAGALVFGIAGGVSLPAGQPAQQGA